MLTIIPMESIDLNGASEASNRAYIGRADAFKSQLEARSCPVYPHTYPNSIIHAVSHPDVPENSIVLNDVQRCIFPSSISVQS